MFGRVGSLVRMFAGRRAAPPRPEFHNLKLRFKEFTYLLRANNEVLAIIAEIQQRRDGGGAMGLDFLRSRYIAASAKVFKMIRHLNFISGDKYLELVHSFDLIRHEIDDFLSRETGEDEGILVLPLAAVERDMGFLVGAKAANLARLARLAVPVSPGFVVTTESFRRIMNQTELGARVRQAVMLLEEPSYPDLVQMSDELSRWIMIARFPPEVETAIEQACAHILESQTGPATLSFRSSAIGEDSETSFAGLYKTVLGVTRAGVLGAYRQVLASLYSPQAVVYRRQRGLTDEDAEMAVLVQIMVEPRTSGVMYTTDPLGGGRGPLLVTAVYGLGAALVDGSMVPDLFTVDRESDVRLVGTRLGSKGTRLALSQGRCQVEPVPPESAAVPSLSEGEVEELARVGLRLEEELGGPQDIEWALSGEGELVILQSRPLKVLEVSREGSTERAPPAPVILTGGQTARPGIGSGAARLADNERALESFTPGDVLVARRSSPAFGAVLPRAAAVVTEVGGVTGHMSSLAREFGVPALVGVEGAFDAIKEGQLITVDASTRRIYAGRIDAAFVSPQELTWCSTSTPVAPPWFPAARLITELTLTDPRSPNFLPARCATFHDIIRFVHEMSFKEMFLLGDRLGVNANSHARRVGHPLPFELLVIDVGGGLAGGEPREVTVDDVTSVPGRAFLEGLLDPRIDWKRPRPLSVRGLGSVISGSIITPPVDGQVRSMGQTSYAILGAYYLNFNCRVGYHFTALDSFCGPNQNDNYVSFRFQGGAATKDRRSLRTELIARIMAPMGFDVEHDGDMAKAFVKKLEQAQTEDILREMGRLVLYTRQMDMLMDSQAMVDWLARAFAEGNYNLDTGKTENAP